eukprot:6489814-Prymnesium_polylepis.1
MSVCHSLETVGWHVTLYIVIGSKQFERPGKQTNNPGSLWTVERWNRVYEPPCLALTLFRGD